MKFADCRFPLISVLSIATLSIVAGQSELTGQSELAGRARSAMKRATEFFHGNAASHGGYVYYYSTDLDQRWGEGATTKDQIWVQPPGTPTVGMAYLEAYRATGDSIYRDAAVDAANALLYGQLKSGGWTNAIDFDPRGSRSANYRNGRGQGKNNSSFDDGQSQSAITFMIQMDAALQFEDEAIHQCALTALDALLQAQFPNGGFPQVWTGPVEPKPVVKANYPDYDWRTQGRIKNYWDMYTLNDNVTGYVAETLITACRIYGDDEYFAALERLGEFLVLAQMPQPQPGWAQQYNYQMHPIWARKFEPPAVSGDETQEAIETLMKIAAFTGNTKYLQPIPDAAAWLRRSLLGDGRVARYYELKTNRPLYMTRRGDRYELTFDDTSLPSHYGWKTDSRLAELGRMYTRAQKKETLSPATPVDELAVQAERAVATLDPRGRWVSRFEGELMVGQLKLPIGTEFLSSQVFSENLSVLSRFVIASKNQ